MISAEKDSANIERAYDLGVTDFIARPFDALIVHHRVINTILLDAKQKKLASMVADQIYEKEQRSSLMIDILSHIVEFRNGESGLHVLHVRTITEMLLDRLAQKTSRYNLTPSVISLIGTASALHDIGKISVDEKFSTTRQADRRGIRHYEVPRQNRRGHAGGPVHPSERTPGEGGL